MTASPLHELKGLLPPGPLHPHCPVPGASGGGAGPGGAGGGAGAVRGGARADEGGELQKWGRATGLRPPWPMLLVWFSLV